MLINVFQLQAATSGPRAFWDPCSKQLLSLLLHWLMQSSLDKSSKGCLLARMWLSGDRRTIGNRLVSRTVVT